MWRAAHAQLRARRRHGCTRRRRASRNTRWPSLEHVRRISSEDVERLLLGNRIFLDRLQNVGVVSAPRTLSRSAGRGPALRGSGVAYDVRKAHPYMKYGEVEFDVPVGRDGDCYDRFVVRIEEIKQAMRIVEQCLERMADAGPVNVDDPRVVLPPKEDVYSRPSRVPSSTSRSSWRA